MLVQHHTEALQTVRENVTIPPRPENAAEMMFLAVFFPSELPETERLGLP